MDRIKKRSSTAVILGIVFLVIACVYSLFFIYPSSRSLGQTRQAIEEQTEKLDRLKLLYPILAQSNILHQIQFKPGLPFPRRVPIHRNELGGLSARISDLAKHNHLVMSGSDFDINSLKNQSQSISMVIELRGKLVDFRQLIIDIIGFEFFDSIEKLTISGDKDPKKKFTLGLNIRIKNKS